MRRFIQYLRYYNEPRHKDLQTLAIESGREYFKDRKPIFSSVEFQAYTRGYINAYRHVYAKNKLEIKNK
jgi:hypothetical protein